jgi:hypothetical protein
LKSSDFDDTVSDLETLGALSDMMLLTFPVFSFNADSMKALCIILDQKLQCLRDCLPPKAQPSLAHPQKSNQDKTRSALAIDVSEIGSSTHQSAAATKSKKSALSFEQQSVQQWVNKKQRWQRQIAALNRLTSCLQDHIVSSSYIDGYVGIVSFGGSLLARERRIAGRLNHQTEKKCYYRWFDAYFQQLELTYLPYTKCLERKVFQALLLERRRSHLKSGKAVSKHSSNLYCKSWLALLKHLTENKEEKEQARKVREAFQDKNRVETAVVVDPVIDKLLPEELGFENTSIY